MHRRGVHTSSCMRRREVIDIYRTDREIQQRSRLMALGLVYLRRSRISVRENWGCC